MVTPNIIGSLPSPEVTRSCFLTIKEVLTINFETFKSHPSENSVSGKRPSLLVQHMQPYGRPQY